MTVQAFLSTSRFRGLGLVALALLLSPSGRVRTAEAQPQAPSFPAGVEVITVDAVVFDSKDRPVSGLTRNDFAIFENGQEREIVSFEAFTDEPVEPVTPATASPVASNEGKPRRSGRAFVLVVDDLRIAPGLSAATTKAVASFLERSVRDGDEVTLGTTSGAAWWSARIPEGRDDLLAVLGRVKGQRVDSRKSMDWMSDYEAYWILNNETTFGLGGGAQGDIQPSTVTERVRTRWKDANICTGAGTGASCDGMIRGRAADVDAQRRTRTQLTLQALRRGLAAVTPMRGRKSVLLFSEGFVDDSTSDQRTTASAAREANAAVYFVDVRGLTALNEVSGAESADQFTTIRDRTTSSFQDALLEAGGAEALAEDTGGFSVRNTNDLAAGAERIALESRTFYLLGVQPLPGKSARDWRKLKVEVNKAGLKVRARRGYSLASSAEADKPKKKDEKKDVLAPAVVRALDSAHDETDIPLRAMAYVFEPLPRNATRVLIAAEFDTRGSGKSPALGPKAELSIVATHRDTGTEYRFDQILGLTGAEAAGASGWRALGREIELPPGVTQVRIVVRDPASGALGSISQRLEIPADKAFRLSTPILTDRVEPATGAGKRPRPAVTAHRSFLPAGGLYVQFEVFGAARPAGSATAQVNAGLTIRAADGRVVRSAPTSPITADAEGRLVRTVGIGIDGLEEGRYVLALDVKDEANGGSLQREEPFTLTRTATR